MECNKEEAIRAKNIAESKMQNKDFTGARKFVLKAQQLYPELENISQVLTVCEVHCSAAGKVNGETDWYGILQVEMTADESVIRKQYRKLALLLHPDKNKFAGAEAAFKLVGEAHMILSDRGKRSLHDMKRAVNYRTVQMRQPPQSNNTAHVRKPAAVPTNSVHFNNIHQHQHQKSAFVSSQTFWTICSNCGTRYQYYRTILNRHIRCQSCMNSFIAYDISAQPAPSGTTSNFSHNNSGIHQKEVSGQRAASAPQQSSFGTGKGFQGNVHGGSTASEPLSKARVNSEVGGGSTEKPKEVGKVSRKRDTNDKVNKKDKKAKQSTAACHKKARKAVVSSDSEGSDSDSESSVHDSESSDNEEMVTEENDHPVQSNAGANGARYPRRSTRQKQNISYNEDGSDDDNDEYFANSSFKRLRKGGSSCNVDQGEGSAGDTFIFEDEKNSKEKQNGHPEGNLPNGSVPRNRSAIHDTRHVINDVKDEEFNAGTSSNAGSSVDTFSYPDPEFYDFEKDRHPSQFAINQIWSLYDQLDGMPRFYARIKNVCSPGFTLCYTWLEYDPISEAETAWFAEELPVACGTFKIGKTEFTQDLLMFSHLMSCGKGPRRNTYEIYPRRGEVWALFKGWDISWSSDADCHRIYDYDVVEVVSDFAEGTGISIIHLNKIKEFVSLFTRAVGEGATLKIPPNEILRFSHKVPSYRLIGNEREGVPKGSIELDAASLPSNFGVAFPSVSLDSVTVEGLDDECIRLDSTPETVVEKSAAGTSKKGTEADEKNASLNQNKNGGVSLDEVSGLCSNKHARSEVFTAECQVDEKLNTDARFSTGHDAIHNDDASRLESSSPITYEYGESEFFNFREERSSQKFQKDQIWALYSDVNEYPNYYGLIKKVEPEDFRVHLMWLEACPMREEETLWTKRGLSVGCGRFKVSHGMEIYETTETFSHLVKAKPSGRKDRYDIYPSRGDVWAVFKNWKVGWSRSDLKNCEYDLVEVIEHTGSRIHGLSLTKVAGYSSVFMPKRKGRDLVKVEIHMDEFLRFSHQIPAFRLTEEEGGKLKGFWELDPDSVPKLYSY